MKKILYILTICFFKFNFAYSLIEVDITRGNLDPLPVAVSPLHVDILLLGGITATRKWAVVNIESVA